MEKYSPFGQKDEYFQDISKYVQAIFTLSVEWSWGGLHGLDLEPAKANHISIDSSTFPIVGEYFCLHEIEDLSEKFLLRIELHLYLLRELGTFIERLSLSEKEKIVRSIKTQIAQLEEQKPGLQLLEKFRDILFVELRIDHIDEIGTARDIMQMLMEKLLLMSK